MSRYAEAMAGLGGAQKSNYGVPAYSRFINRKLGRIFAAMAFSVGLSPTQVTGISASFSATGIVLLGVLRPSLWVGLVVAVLLVLGYALDAADGQLARLTKAGSMHGEWLDHTLDAAKISALHLGVLIGWFRFGDMSDGWLMVPVVFEVVAVVRFSSMVLVDQLRRSVGHVIGAGGEGSSLARSFGTLFIDFGLLCLVFALWGSPAVFRWPYLALCATNAVYLLVVSVKHFSELRRLSLKRAAAKVGAA